jgi:hypothetical protein
MIMATTPDDEELTDCVGYEAGEKDSTTLHDSNRNERREHSVVAIMVGRLSNDELLFVDGRF